jgi:transcriptional regulator with XRE-family HTH domain
MSTYGLRIKKSRIAKGWSQEDLAAHAGVSQSTVSAIETGEREANETPFLLGKTLGKRPEWLVTGKGPEDQAEMPDVAKTYYVVAESPEELAEKLLAKGDDHVIHLLALVMELKNKKSPK